MQSQKNQAKVRKKEKKTKKNKQKKGRKEAKHTTLPTKRLLYTLKKKNAVNAIKL